MTRGSVKNDGIERHRTRLVRLAAVILGDADEAADVVQEAYFAFWRSAAPIEFELAWLLRVTANGARDRVRARRVVSFDGVVEAAATSRRGPFDEARDKDEGRRVRAALAALPRMQRTVITRRLVEGAKFREIASELGISEGATKVHFRRAVTATRRRLGDRE